MLDAPSKPVLQCPQVVEVGTYFNVSCSVKDQGYPNSNLILSSASVHTNEGIIVQNKEPSISAKHIIHRPGLVKFVCNANSDFKDKTDICEVQFQGKGVFIYYYDREDRYFGLGCSEKYQQP